MCQSQVKPRDTVPRYHVIPECSRHESRWITIQLYILLFTVFYFYFCPGAQREWMVWREVGAVVGTLSCLICCWQLLTGFVSPCVSALRHRVSALFCRRSLSSVYVPQSSMLSPVDCVTVHSSNKKKYPFFVCSMFSPIRVLSISCCAYKSMKQPRRSHATKL